MSVIDVEALLGEFTAGLPCGEDLEYDPAFAQMEEQAQETPERQYGDTIIPAEPADWRSVKKTALALAGRTRDLRVAVYLSRALLHTDGLPGFAEGLALVDGLIERFGDQLYPQLDPDDDNDPTLRVNTVVALCDPETTLPVPRETPLVHSRSLGRICLRDIHIASGALTPLAKEEGELPTPAKIKGAFQEVGPETIQATAALIAGAMESARRIEADLTDRIGVSQAPDMSALSSALKEMRHALSDHLQQQGIALTDDGAAETEAGGELQPAGSALTGGSPRLVVGEIASREDALRMIDKICEFFDRYEPSSPVPLLLRRAKRLATKDFMAILLDLAPGGADQAQLIFGPQGDNPE
jgi:type VI secretion system protein ImpA